MTDPARLLNTRLDSVSRRAIEAAVSEEPPEQAKAQIWQSIALSLPATGVLLGVTTTTSAAAAGGNVAASGAVAGGAVGTGVATAGSNIAAAGAVASAIGTGAEAMVAGAAGVTALGTTGLGLIAGKAVALGLGIGLAVHVATGVVQRASLSHPATAIASSKTLGTDAVASAYRPRTAAPATGGVAPPEIESTQAVPQVPIAPLQAVASTRLVPSFLTEPPKLLTQGNAEVPAGQRDVTVPTANLADEGLSDELRQESSLLVRARQALAASQPAVAMAYVNQHRQRFANGMLLQEREALEVQCLAKLGRIAEARLRATAFLTRYPASPHREKMRTIAGP